MTAAASAAAGLGVSILPESMLEGLTLIPLEDEGSICRIGMMTRKEGCLPPAALRFVECAAEVFGNGGKPIYRRDIRMPEFNRVVPIIRMFDVGKAKEFYLDFLGAELLWEHRFEEALPLYMAIKLGGCELHLSEHHGDGSPGANIRIETAGLADYHKALLDSGYRYARPGLEKPPWGGCEATVMDPFGNRITFYEEDGV
ncbi:hypothetical protein KXR95_06910 [Paenibacillus humicus]